MCHLNNDFDSLKSEYLLFLTACDTLISSCVSLIFICTSIIRDWFEINFISFLRVAYDFVPIACDISKSSCDLIISNSVAYHHNYMNFH